MKAPRPDTREGYELFHKGMVAMAKVSANGIRIDTEYLDRTIKQMSAELRQKEEEFRASGVYKTWRRLYGGGSNLASAAQLAGVLSELGLHCPELTDTGRPKVNEASLRRLDADFVDDYIGIRKLHKTVDTYLTGIRREVSPDGFLHPDFNLTSSSNGNNEKGGAESFRGSSSAPNFSEPADPQQAHGRADPHGVRAPQG